MLSGMSLCRDVVDSIGFLEIPEAVQTFDREVGAREVFAVLGRVER